MIHGVPHLINHGIGTVRKLYFTKGGIRCYRKGICRIRLKFIIAAGCRQILDSGQLIALLQKPQFLIGHTTVINTLTGAQDTPLFGIKVIYHL